MHMAEDLIAEIMTGPWIYLVMITIVMYLGLTKYLDTKPRPEQQAFWGKRVRDDMTNKIISKRNSVWAATTNYKLIRGFNTIGKIGKMELITRKNDKTKKDEEFYIMSLKQAGFFGWLKSLLGKFEYFVADPKVLTINHKDKHIIVNPYAFVVEDSGVWTLSTNKESGLIDDLNVKVDLENIKGFSSDFLRRLSNEHPAQALYTERQQHGAELEEKARLGKVGRWINK